MSLRTLGRVAPGPLVRHAAFLLLAGPGVARAQPSNDECAGAIPLVEGLNGPFTNIGATSSPCSVCCNFQDVWFLYAASCTGTASFTVCPPGSATFSNVLAAYTGSCGSLEIADCQSAVCSAPEPGVQVNGLTAGQTVHLRVGSLGTVTPGSFSVFVSCQVPADDLGDAPSNSAAVARHTNAGLGARLGTQVTLEAATATPSWSGDSGDDGIVSVSDLFPGSATATIVVNATNPSGTSLGHVRLWPDREPFLHLNLFSSLEALPSQSGLVGPSGASFTFGPFFCPITMPASPYVRVRLSEDAAGVASSSGTAAGGEVEDFVLPGTGGPVSLTFPGGGGTDAGDAPLPYPPCNAPSIALARLGLVVTGDANCPVGFPTTGDAAWDDDAGDDGIARISGLAPGGSCSITVRALCPLGFIPTFLSGWIDFDGDGNWDEPGEAFASVGVLSGPLPVEATLGPLPVPAGAVLPFRTRLKLYEASSPGVLTAGQQPNNGEVEDYLLPSQPCSACSTVGPGAPSLFAVDPPRLGGTLVLRTVGAWPSASVLTVFANFFGPGADLTSFGLPIPPGVCFLCTPPQLLLAGGTTDGAGELEQVFAVPGDPAFTAAPVVFQNLQLVPGGGGLGVLVTNALSTSILPQ